MKQRLLGALAIAVCVSFVACAKREKILARVGDQKITLGEFQDVYRPPMTTDSLAALAEKRKVLDQLIDQKLLVIEALSRNLDKDSSYQRGLDEAKRDVLLRQLFKEEVLNKSKTTDADARTFYKKMSLQIKARHILVKTKAEADDILKSLKAGTAFETLAQQRSEDKASAQRGGELGWFGWGQMVEEFQKAAFSLKPGQTSQPVKTSFGFHIIRVDSSKTADVPPYEQVKDRIKKQMGSNRQRELVTSFLTRLKEGAKIKVNPEVLAGLAAQQTQAAIPLPKFPDQDMGKTLVTYRGGTWTVQKFYDSALKFNNGIMDLGKADMVNQFVEQILMGDLLYARAKSQGLEANAAVKQQLRKVREDLLASAQYRDEVEKKVVVPADSVTGYYNGHKKEFLQSAQAMAFVIVVKTQPEADQVYQMLQKGADFSAVAKEKSIDWTKGQGGALGMLRQGDPQYPDYTKRAFAVPLNQPTRPFPVKEGFAILKVASRSPASQITLEQAKPDIENKFRQTIEEGLYKRYTEGLRKKYPATIDQAVLAAAAPSPEVREP